MDKVAALAGVAVQSVYRRWASKAPLVAEAVMKAASLTAFTLPDTGDTADDVRTWMRDYAALSAVPENGPLIRALAAAAAEDLHDRDTLYRQLTGPVHESVKQRLRQGISQRQIREDVDIEAVADALIGAPLYRILSGTATPTTMAEHCSGLVDALMAGLLLR